MKVSKRAVAREWLIFLATFALSGGILIFFFAYYDSAGWHGNYEDWFATIFLCFALYVGVTLIRSIWWSIKALNISKRARYGIVVSIATIIAAGGGAIGIRNAVNRRQDVAKSESTPERRPESTPKSTPEFNPDEFLKSHLPRVGAPIFGKLSFLMSPMRKSKMTKSDLKPLRTLCMSRYHG